MPEKPSAKRRYLAIWLPLLSADRWLLEQGNSSPERGGGSRSETEGPVGTRSGSNHFTPAQPGPSTTSWSPSPFRGGSLAFIEKQRGAMRIVAVNEVARDLGLAPGMALADARARLPDLETAPHDPDADARMLEAIADDCERYTPMVALDPPGGLILDITGCVHIWGGEMALVSALAARLVHAGFSIKVALAETPDRARALARHGGEMLSARRRTPPEALNDVRHSYRARRPLPVAALDLDERQTNALRRAGLHSIDDLAARPRTPLSARFGKAMVLKLARVLGEDDARITPRRAPPALFFTRRFAEPIGRNEHVMAAIGDLAREAEQALRQRGQGGRWFGVSLFRSDGDIRRLGLETGAPARDPALLLRLFRERIESLADPLDPGFGYDAIRLDVSGAETLRLAQTGFDDRAEAGENADALADRLAVRLGQNRVRKLVPGNSHIPELAGFSAPYATPTLPFPALADAQDADDPPLRPLRLFDPPQRIEVIAEVPDGPPQTFKWRRRTHRVRLSEGPERIAAEWWRKKAGYEPDKGGATRDYFRVEDSDGRRFWLFRHGLYSGENPHPDWYLHGAFG